MIQRRAHIELLEFDVLCDSVRLSSAVALFSVEGTLVEPLVVVIDETGRLTVTAEATLAYVAEIQAHIGGTRFLALPKTTRDRIGQIVVPHAFRVFRRGAA